MTWSPMRVGEVEILTADFSKLLAPGETITSAVCSNNVVSGGNPSPGDMIVGSTSISGPLVSQEIAALVAGTYAPLWKAQTSLGQTLILPDIGYDTLVVM